MTGTKVEVLQFPKCDFSTVQSPHPAKYDGKTTMGPWANMCQAHFDQHGIGLGTGLGQELILREKKDV